MAAPNNEDDAQQEALTVALIAIYLAANAVMVRDFGRFVREALSSSDIDYKRLRRRILRSANSAIADLSRRTPALLNELFSHSQTSANSRALSEYTRAAKEKPDEAQANKRLSHYERSVAAIQAELDSRLGEVRTNILRSGNDLYKEIVAEAAKAQVSGRKTPQEAAAHALDRFLEKGITGFVTKDGKHLPIDSYVDMAVRTAALRAYNVVYEARLTSIGVEYFTVPNDGTPCPYCWPWQGAVLSPLGKDNIADASIEQARKAGLFHPQCRHVLLPFFPGINTRPERDKPWTDEQQSKYNATQKQRSLERRVRQQKAARDNAAGPAEKLAASKRIRSTEAAIRKHVAQHNLVRRRHREKSRINTG